MPDLHGRPIWRGWVLLACLVVACQGDFLPAAEKVQFNRDIRPILAENCFACHGPDSASRKANLRLDKREAAIEAGAISPGKLDESELIKRIRSDEASERMPPPKTKKNLTENQKKLLEEWVASGAAYQPHWSFIAPVRPPLPAVKNLAWVRNPIDRFILSKVEAAGLTPAPEADRRTLARRVCLDLTGLPPSPDMVEAFVQNQSPRAYEEYVDKLLESPHWGEHRGRYWLDAARYADTHGIHFDNYREMWSFRDWVIAAFNRNMPFDQFTIEQLAGDLLPNRTLDQQVASGFNRCNITTNEGGAIAEEYLVLYARDRTETTSQVWLGLTAGCAVCHDHKFDPLSQREFYQLTAFFNNTVQKAMDGNIKDTPPVVVLPAVEDRPRWAALQVEKDQVTRQMTSRQGQRPRPRSRNGWVPQVAEELARRIPTRDMHFHARLDEGKGRSFSFQADGKERLVTIPEGVAWGAGQVYPKAFKSPNTGTIALANVGDFEKSQAFSYGAWIKLPANNLNGAAFARMDDVAGYRGWDLWIEGGKPGVHILHGFPDDAIKVVALRPLKAGAWEHVFVTYDGSGKAAGVAIYVDGKRVETNIANDTLKGSIRTPVAFTVAQRHKSSRMANIQLQDLRIFGRALGAEEVARLADSTRGAYLASIPADKRSGPEVEELFAWWLANLDPLYREFTKKRTALDEEAAAITTRGTEAHVMEEKAEMPVAHILFRGDYDKRRDAVKPMTPAFLPPLAAGLPQNRFGFAKWLLRPENPLTSRVTVNRFWQELFGAGIVRTTGDFGISGELPSHPELLDWLAVEFRESGWDVKEFFKLLVTSATYRQAATTTPEKLFADAPNRLLSRGPRFRMDGEMVRDYALAASGLLVEKLGGPSVKPYQPDGVWEAVAMNVSNTSIYRRDQGNSLYRRRSLYTFLETRGAAGQHGHLQRPQSRDLHGSARTNRHPFAGPGHLERSPVRRGGALSGPAHLEGAGPRARLAPRFPCRPGPGPGLSLRGKGDGRVAYVARPARLLPWLTPEDARKLIATGEAPVDPALAAEELAAWTMLTNQIFNLDEVLNK